MAMSMILPFTLISIAAACLGLYSLRIEWEHLNTHERADVVLSCTLLAIISVLALAASFSGPFK
jgi:hypothetical protein